VKREQQRMQYSQTNKHRHVRINNCHHYVHKAAHRSET